MSSILITGGTGCIGSVTVSKLLRYSGIRKITVATRSGKGESLKLWLGDTLDARIEFVSFDLSDYESVERLTLEVNPTHILHLGGLQSPDCSSCHLRGVEVNVGGTMALLDAAEKLPHLERLVFAGSAAVYGKRSKYSGATIGEDVRLTPPNHYGIWKMAGEHLARLFYWNTHIPTICLRLNTTYGPGRDKGMTSAPTLALKAVALGSIRNKTIPFVMPYQGLENYHYVEDVGAHFAACTMQPFEGYGVFNIKGQTIGVNRFLEIVREQAEASGWGRFVDLSIAPDANPNIFSYDLNHERIEKAFPNLPLTGIWEGVEKSLRIFRKMAVEGALNLNETRIRH